MDKKIKLWKNIQKWICNIWVLWVLALAWDTYGDSAIGEGLIFGFVLIWPILFLVLLILTYYEIEKLREVGQEKPVKKTIWKYLSLLIKRLVIIFDILWVLWIIIPGLSWGYCYNCMIWIHYLKALIIIGNLYYLIDLNKIRNVFKSLVIKIEVKK